MGGITESAGLRNILPIFGLSRLPDCWTSVPPYHQGISRRGCPTESASESKFVQIVRSIHALPTFWLHRSLLITKQCQEGQVSRKGMWRRMSYPAVLSLELNRAEIRRFKGLGSEHLRSG